MDALCQIPGFESLSWPVLLFLLVVIGTAALMHGSLGVGFPMLATPLLAMVTDVRCAMLIILLPTLVINLANIAHGGRWRESIGRYWPLAVYGAVGSAAGTRLLIVVDPAPFKLVLAGALLLYLNIHRFGVRLGWVPTHPRAAMALFGTAAGILGGTVNVMLPALVIFALELRLATTASVQVFNLCFFVGKSTQAVVFAQAGLLTAPLLGATLPLALFALVALWVGMRLRDRIAADTYRAWLRRVLGAIALLLIVQYVLQATGA